jgi:hypothetical protein
MFNNTRLGHWRLLHRCYLDFLGLSFSTHSRILFSSEYFHYAVGPQFTNAPVHEQFGSRTNFPSQKKSRMTNGFSDYEHASWQQRQAESISAGVNCWLNLSQYTSLLDFGLRTFRFTNGLQERIKFVNRGPTVLYLPLAARYNWCQGPVPGRGPAVGKHCYNAREKCLLLILTFRWKWTRRLSTESGEVTNFDTT